MDEKMLLDIFNRVFGGDATALELALTRLKLQAELVQINSKVAVVQEEFNKNADQYNGVLAELAVLRSAKQAEIDALEAK
jgi:hypothetical protein